MNILLIEDELLVAHFVQNILLELGHTVRGIATNYTEAAELILQKPDLAIVDIKLSEGQSGIHIAEKLNEIQIPFIFLTANNEQSTIEKAIHTNPVAYLTKPIVKTDIFAALQLVKVKLEKEQHKPSIELKTKLGSTTVNLEDILYIQAENVYVHIFTENEQFTQRNTLKEFEKKLSSSSFIRIHRSYCINKKFLEAFTNKVVIVSGIELPVSRTHLQNLKLP